MGSDHSDSQGQSFRREDWEVVERGETSATWQNLRDPTQKIEQYDLYASSEEEYNRQKEIYYLRKNSAHLVAAHFLSSEASSDFCSSHYQQRLFVEKIPIRLADIEHIPFPDFLHLYSQSLRGYAELASHVGCFPVEEDFVGINERGVAKVWLAADFSRSQPAGSRVPEDVMVRNVVDMVDRNLDQALMPPETPSVRTYLYRRTDRITFGEAISELTNFARDFNGGVIPPRLECIDRVGGIYAIANRDKSLLPNSPLRANTPIQQEIIVENSGLTSQQQLIAQNTAFPSQSRPRLDSELLSPPFQSVSAPFQSSQLKPSIYREPVRGSQVVPNFQQSLLTPSTVRENIPVVRHAPPVFSRSEVNISQPFFGAPQNIVPVESPQPAALLYRQSRPQFEVSPQPKISPRPQAQFQGALSQGIAPQSQSEVRSPQISFTKAAAPTSLQANSIAIKQAKVGQSIPNQGFSQNGFTQQSQQTQLSQNSSQINQNSIQLNQSSQFNQNNSQVGNNLYNILSNESNPTIRAPEEPVFFQQTYQQNYQPQPQPQQQPNSFMYQQSAAVDLDVQRVVPTNTLNASSPRRISSPAENNFQLKSAESSSSNNYGNGALNAIYNESPSTVLPQEPVLPTYNPSYGSYNTTNVFLDSAALNEPKGYSEANAINIDDGKSSSDFLKMLNSLATFKQPATEPFKFQNQQFGSLQQKNYDYSSLNTAVESEPKSNYFSYKEYQSSQGEGNTGNQAAFEGQGSYKAGLPLKFEESMEFKYSNLGGQSQPYVYKKYETSFDPELLLDINNLKQ